MMAAKQNNNSEEALPMLTFLRDLVAHAEWANAVFFHVWATSPARDHEELRRRVGHVVGVHQGFLSILRGEAPGRPPDGPPPPFDDLKTRAVTGHAGLRDFPAALDAAGLARPARSPRLPPPPSLPPAPDAPPRT